MILHKCDSMNMSTLLQNIPPTFTPLDVETLVSFLWGGVAKHISYRFSIPICPSLRPVSKQGYRAKSTERDEGYFCDYNGIDWKLKISLSVSVTPTLCAHEYNIIIVID